MRARALANPRIHHLRQDNRGVSAARNAGIGAARGRCLMFIDDPHCAQYVQLCRANPPAVVLELKKMGFTNIQTEPLYDIIWGITDDGELDSVYISGKTNFKRGEIFAKDAKILVKYHTLSENDPQKNVQKEKVPKKISKKEAKRKSYIEDRKSVV